MSNEKNSNEEHGVRLSYKFRIYPTAAQCEAIKANIDASRFVYNHYLRARMDAYERTQQELRRPKPACDEQGNVQYDQDGKEIWERTEGGKVVFHTVPNPTYDPAAKAMSMFARQTGRRTYWRPARTSLQSRSSPSSPRRRSSARRSEPSSHESKVG